MVEAKSAPISFEGPVIGGTMAIINLEMTVSVDFMKMTLSVDFIEMTCNVKCIWPMRTLSIFKYVH